MASVAQAAGPARGLAWVRQDPALSVAVLSLWLLLGLFVVFPLAMLAARVFWDGGHFSVAGIGTILTDRHQIGVVHDDVRHLEHGVVEQRGRNRFFGGPRLVLELRHAAQLAVGSD